jgi:hypothetical protein
MNGNASEKYTFVRLQRIIASDVRDYAHRKRHWRESNTNELNAQCCKKQLITFFDTLSKLNTCFNWLPAHTKATFTFRWVTGYGVQNFQKSTNHL